MLVNNLEKLVRLAAFMEDLKGEVIPLGCEIFDSNGVTIFTCYGPLGNDEHLFRLVSKACFGERSYQHIEPINTNEDWDATSFKDFVMSTAKKFRTYREAQTDLKCTFCNFMALTRTERIHHEESVHPKESLKFFGRMERLTESPTTTTPVSPGGTQ